jgi:hypothetical protein
MSTLTIQEFSPVFNPDPSIERIQLSNGSSYFVVDDALSDPERLVRFAADRANDFRNVDFNAYPGIFLMTPTVAISLTQFFNRHVRRLFDARRLLHMHCRLSMVTLPPHTLKPYQRMCHRDLPVLQPNHSIQAAILYLFRDSGLGGTSFYEPARSPVEMTQLFTDASTLPAEAFDLKHDFKAGYMAGSNHYFTCIGTAAAKWNRLIFYDGYCLHSGDILAPERLVSDPTAGRLTLNAFFSCRRNASASASAF